VARAIKLCRNDESIPELDSLVVCGGVAANQQVRARLLAVAEKNEIRAVFPPGAPCRLHRAAPPAARLSPRPPAPGSCCADDSSHLRGQGLFASARAAAPRATHARCCSSARLCTDNGVMVAWAGVERLQLGALDDPTDMEVRARWPLGVSHTPADGSVRVTSTKHTKLTSTRVVSGAPAAPAPSALTATTAYQDNKKPWDV